MACPSFHLTYVNDDRHSVSKTDTTIAKSVAKLQQKRKSLSKDDTEGVVFAETA